MGPTRLNKCVSALVLLIDISAFFILVLHPIVPLSSNINSHLKTITQSTSINMYNEVMLNLDSLYKKALQTNRHPCILVSLSIRSLLSPNDIKDSPNLMSTFTRYIQLGCHHENPSHTNQPLQSDRMCP